VAALTWAAYAGVFDHQFVTWDDPAYVSENPLVQQRDYRALLTAVVSANYHPLTMLSLAMNATPTLAPAPFLETNVLLHVANTLLVFWLVLLLSSRRLVAATAAALLFGIHPMHVESVAWVSERKDVLYTLFFLAGALAYWRYLERRATRWLIVAFALFVLSCLSKGMAVVFPLVMALLDLWKGRPVLERRSLAEKAPFLAVALLFGLVAVNVQSGGDLHGLLAPIERNLKPLGPPPGVTPLARMLLPTLGYAMYVWRLFVPVRLSAFYPYPDLSGFRPELLIAPLFFVGTIAIAIRDLGRTRVLTFGLGWYLVTIVLVLQWIPVGTAMMADRYAYLSYVGLLFVLGMGLAHVLERRRPLGVALLVFAGVGAAFLFTRTVRQVETWKDSDALWGRVIQLSPDYDQAYINRANDRGRTGRIEEALADLRTAYGLGSRRAEMFLNLGNVYSTLGRMDSAVVLYTEALRADPSRGAAYSNRAIVLLRLGRPREALADLEKSRELLPMRAATLHLPIGEAYRQLGRFAEAEDELDRAIASGNRRAQVFYDRGLTRAARGNRDGAIEDLREALRLDPTLEEARSRLTELGG
jgi:protein O-mannosyl-transferase